MLEGLDRVDWSKQIHAYGPATDVPDQIRALTSPSGQVRREAMWKLYGNIFHQGSRYPATAYAIPFLYELLDNKGTAHRHEIIYLLISLALGYENETLPGGVDLGDVSSIVEGLENVPDPDRWPDFSDDQDFEIMDRLSVRWALRAYEEVARGVSKFIPLAGDPDPDVRMAVVYALAWFPAVASQMVSVVRGAVEAETDPYLVANAILSLGLVDHYLDVRTDLPRLEQYLESDDPEVVQVAAAIALATIEGASASPRALHVLINALRNTDHLREEGKHLRWNDGDLVGYVSLILSSLGRDQPERVVPALATALKSVRPLASLDVTRALLDLVFAANLHPRSLRSPRDLDPLQLQALKAIAEHGAWTVKGTLFANYSSLVSSYGLPGSSEELARFLEGSRDR